MTTKKICHIVCKQKMSKFPRILVISTDPFSKESPNGRTLGSLFTYYPPECIAQLYSNDYSLDLIDCKYFQISDKMLLKSLFSFRRPGKETYYKDFFIGDPAQAKPKFKKTPFSCLVRDLLWSTGLYKSKALKKWLNDFDPECIILFASDRPFQFNFVRKFSKKRNIPLFIYNSEEYYFSSRSYLNRKAEYTFLYHTWFSRIKRSFNKMMNQATYCIYISEELEEQYGKFFPNQKAIALYTSTDWKPIDYHPAKRPFAVSFFGRIYLGRAHSLIDIATALHNTGLPYTFKVCGTGKEKEIQRLKRCPYLEFRSIVPYNEVEMMSKESDLILNVTSLKGNRSINALFQFSTKVPDCLASGVPFLAYGAKELSFMQYLKKHDAAFVAESKEEMEEIISLLVNKPSIRTKHIRKALKLVEQNHDIIKNCDKFNEIIISNCKKKN